MFYSSRTNQQLLGLGKQSRGRSGRSNGGSLGRHAYAKNSGQAADRRNGSMIGPGRGVHIQPDMLRARVVSVLKSLGENVRAHEAALMNVGSPNIVKRLKSVAGQAAWASVTKALRKMPAASAPVDAGAGSRLFPFAEPLEAPRPRKTRVEELRRGSPPRQSSNLLRKRERSPLASVGGSRGYEGDHDKTPPKAKRDLAPMIVEKPAQDAMALAPLPRKPVQARTGPAAVSSLVKPQKVADSFAKVMFAAAESDKGLFEPGRDSRSSLCTAPVEALAQRAMGEPRARADTGASAPAAAAKEEVDSKLHVSRRMRARFSEDAAWTGTDGALTLRIKGAKKGCEAMLAEARDQWLAAVLGAVATSNSATTAVAAEPISTRRLVRWLRLSAGILPPPLRWSSGVFERCLAEAAHEDEATLDATAKTVAAREV